MLPEAVLNYETYAFFIGVSIIALKKDNHLTVLYLHNINHRCPEFLPQYPHNILPHN